MLLHSGRKESNIIIILIIKRVPAAFIVKVFQTVAKIKNVLLCDFDVDLKL